MYEELAKRLKEKASRFDYDGWVDTAAILEEAADAIEELTRIVKEYQKFDGFLAAHGMFEPPKEEAE